MHKVTLFGLILGGFKLLHGVCHADGVFVFTWNKQIDINEPTQKAIILYDQGREDLVLQVKYEGPAEEFGWLVPVPGLPDVKKGSMDCFYELSKLTQEISARENHLSTRGAIDHKDDDAVHVIEIKTVGAYDVAVLSAGTGGKLTQWLDANGFKFPKEKQEVLDDYIKKNWYFVAAKIDPHQAGFTTSKQLASGELAPLVISFDSEKCVYPLRISSVNGKPSEISLYVLSQEPLMSRAIFDKRYASYARAQEEWVKQAPERVKKRKDAMDRQRQKMDDRMRSKPGPFDDPNDLRPANERRSIGIPASLGFDESSRDYPGRPGEEPLVFGLEAGPTNLVACSKVLPRLAGKSWWVIKQVQTFAPEEMQDLEFEPVLPILASKLRDPASRGVASCLPQFGSRAVSIIVASAKSSDPVEQHAVADALGMVKAPELCAAIPELLRSTDPEIRQNACYAAMNNWDDSFAPRMVELLNDTDNRVRGAASYYLGQHRDESRLPTYQKMVKEDGLAASQAITLLQGASFSREELIRFFASTNLPVVSTAFSRLRYTLTVDELDPLLNNSLPMARLMALGELNRIKDKPAIDKMVAMLGDSNETVQWRVRNSLRRIWGQKLGADPAAYEKWWKENRDTFAAN
jgi:HEAT repeat protein